MNLSELMTRAVVSVEMDDSLRVVKALFDRLSFHHLLVIEGGKLVGVISDRDLLKSISPRIGTNSESEQDLATLNKRVHQIMRRKPHALFPESTLDDAISLFCHQHISCIPVVNDQGKPVGIVSWRDIMKSLEKNHG